LRWITRSWPTAQVFVVDPMLATGGSAMYALARLKDAGARVFGT
jgi:uracil phosphoribosyltransferase